jgi:hypothetical protein
LAAGDDVDHAAGGAVAIQHAGAAARDFDAVHGVDRDGRQDGVAQFIFRQAHAIQHDHQILAAVGAEAAQVQAEVRAAVQRLAAIHAADLADGRIDITPARRISSA